MVRKVNIGANRLPVVYRQDVAYTLLYTQGKKYYLREPRWRDTVIPEEYLSTSINPWINLAIPIYPTVVSASNDNQFVIRIQFSHVLANDLATVASAFSVKDNINTTFAVQSSAAGIDNSELALTLANFSAASGNMTITYNPAVRQLAADNQGSLFNINAFTLVFTPVLNPPKRYTSEYINAGFTQINLAVTPINYISNYSTDIITTGISNINLGLTQVYYTNLYSNTEIITAAVNTTLILTRVSNENPSPL